MLLVHYFVYLTSCPIMPPTAAPPIVPTALPPVSAAPPTAPIAAPTAVLLPCLDMPAQPHKVTMRDAANIWRVSCCIFCMMTPLKCWYFNGASPINFDMRFVIVTNLIELHHKTYCAVELCASTLRQNYILRNVRFKLRPQSNRMPRHGACIEREQSSEQRLADVRDGFECSCRLHGAQRNCRSSRAGCRRW